MSKQDKKNWRQFKEKHQSKEPKKAEHLENTVDLSEAVEHLEPSLDHPSYVELSEKLTLAEQKAHENWEKAVRAQAELDNVRRRTEREIANAHRYGVEKLITDLLPVM